MSSVFKRKLRKGREWKPLHLREWEKVLERYGVDETAELEKCEKSVSVRACSDHPNEHAFIFKTRHYDSAYCPVCTVRRWEKETNDIYQQLKGLSNIYFHLVFTLPPVIRDRDWSRKDFRKFRKIVRDTVSKTLGGFPGGPMSIHLYGDHEPGKLKPHIHLIIPNFTVLPDGTVKRFNYIPEDVLKKEYLKRLRRRFKTDFEGIPVVYIQWFPESKLYHRVRYLVHPPFEVSDILEIDLERNEIVLKMEGEFNHRKKTIRVPAAAVIRALRMDRKRGHRYQWFGFMAYNARERYRKVIYIPRRVKPEKATCPVCGAETVHVGYIDHDGFSLNPWLYGDFVDIFQNERVMEEFRRHPPPECVLI